MHRAAMVPTIAMDPIMKFFLSLVLVDGLSSSFHLPIYILTKLLPSFYLKYSLMHAWEIIIIIFDLL